MNCISCYDEINASNSISCNSDTPHPICAPCFSDYTKNGDLLPKILDSMKIDNCIPCVCCEHLYPPRNDIANIDILKSYFDIELKLEHESARQEIKQEMIAANSKKNFKDKIYGDICEIASTCKKCPYCLTAFFDFSGCMALHCIACDKHFCGFCLQIHNGDDGISVVNRETASTRCHNYVKDHTESLSSRERATMKITSMYFMEFEAWQLHIKYTVMLDLIKKYLNTIKMKELYPIMNSLLDALLEHDIISYSIREDIKISICSNSDDSITTAHRIRIPLIFSIIYSEKTNMRIEDLRPLTADQKMSMGNAIKSKIEILYPGWEPHKIRVPGETYSAISYPVFMYNDIYGAILSWGKTRDSGGGRVLWR